MKEGDRVGVPWLHTACGYCEHCLTGWETLCGAQQNTGYSVNGGFAEYALAARASSAACPDRLDCVAAAPVLCAGVTVYKGLKETEAKPGEWVVISGIGGLGHMAVQYARAMGLHVVAVDVHDDKLALARALGADIAINAREGGSGGRDPEARSAAPTASWSPPYRRPPSRRRSACCARAAPCRWSGCRPGDSRCRSSTSSSSA